MFFFFNDTATTEIYTLSLHDALPICVQKIAKLKQDAYNSSALQSGPELLRSEEHTSELQSRLHLVCRLLLEKKKERKSVQKFSYSFAELLARITAKPVALFST